MRRASRSRCCTQRACSRCSWLSRAIFASSSFTCKAVHVYAHGLQPHGHKVHARVLSLQPDENKVVMAPPSAGAAAGDGPCPPDPHVARPPWPRAPPPRAPCAPPPPRPVRYRRVRRGRNVRVREGGGSGFKVQGSRPPRHRQGGLEVWVRRGAGGGLHSVGGELHARLVRRTHLLELALVRAQPLHQPLLAVERRPVRARARAVRRSGSPRRSRGGPVGTRRQRRALKRLR